MIFEDEDLEFHSNRASKELFSKHTSSCRAHRGTHTSELCVWECQGTVWDTLGTSALIRIDPSRRSATIFFTKKKNPTPRMTQLFKELVIDAYDRFLNDLKGNLIFQNLKIVEHEKISQNLRFFH